MHSASEERDTQADKKGGKGCKCPPSEDNQEQKEGTGQWGGFSKVPDAQGPEGSTAPSVSQSIRGLHLILRHLAWAPTMYMHSHEIRPNLLVKSRKTHKSVYIITAPHQDSQEKERKGEGGVRETNLLPETLDGRSIAVWAVVSVLLRQWNSPFLIQHCHQEGSLSILMSNNSFDKI